MMNVILQTSLLPGNWYWWIYVEPPRGERTEPRVHKFCVVRCINTEDGPAVNISEDLDEDQSYYLGELAGAFYGPIAPPVPPP